MRHDDKELECYEKTEFQCADVHKTLLIVSKVADLGYDCLLGETEGQMIDAITSDIVPSTKNVIYTS